MFPCLKDVFNANGTNSICIQILCNYAIGEIFIPGVIMMQSYLIIVANVEFSK